MIDTETDPTAHTDSQTYTVIDTETGPPAHTDSQTYTGIDSQTGPPVRTNSQTTQLCKVLSRLPLYILFKLFAIFSHMNKCTKHKAFF